MSTIALRERAVTAAPWLLLAAALVLPTAIAIHRAIERSGGEALGDFGIVPDFALVERSGRPLERADLAGAPWFADFVFTHCSGSCPTLSAEMARLSGRIGDRARLVSISVDPERDRPDVLAAYAARFDASPDRWLFLTGEPAAVRKLVVQGFHLAAVRDEGGGDDAITHSDHVALVDGNFRIRRYYAGGDGAWIDEAVRDLDLLADG